MAIDFNANPILNSPYEIPKRHWQVDDQGKPTGGLIEGRRASQHLVPIPASVKNKSKAGLQPELELEDTTKPNPIVNDIRRQVDKWRSLHEDKWGVTYVTRSIVEAVARGRTTRVLSSVKLKLLKRLSG